MTKRHLVKLDQINEGNEEVIKAEDNQKNSQFVSTCSSDGNSNFKKVRSSFESFAFLPQHSKRWYDAYHKSHPSETQQEVFRLH